MQRLAGWIARGMKVAREALTQVGHDVQDLRAVDGLLKPSDEATGEEREGQCVSLWQEWEASVDPMHQPCAKVMSRCEPGVFVGGEGADFPADHWDVERWFTGPTGHERRASRPAGGPRTRQDHAPSAVPKETPSGARRP